MSNLIVAL
jgi:hypothetical protein